MPAVLTEIQIESGLSWEFILARSLGWINAMYRHTVKKKLEDFRTMAMFSRASAEFLENFNADNMFTGDEYATDFRKQKGFDVRKYEGLGISYKKVKKSNG